MKSIRRRVALMGLLLLLALSGFMNASAGASSHTAPVVQPKSQWTMWAGAADLPPPNGFCGLLTFARHHKFHDSYGDTGTWSGTAQLSISWKTGLWTGLRFGGTFNAAMNKYVGAATFPGGTQTNGSLMPGNVGCPP
jgi:hypothetical protein